MKKNVLGSVLGIALAAVLALGNGMAVRAEGADPSYSFNKVYKLAGDCQPGAVSPEEKFIFDDGADTGAEANVAKLYAVSCTKYNAADALDTIKTLNNDELTTLSAVATVGITGIHYDQDAVNKTKSSVTKAVALTVPDAAKYGSVGYYYYQFKETTGTTAGVIYAADTYAIRVAVVNGKNGLEISNVGLRKVTDDQTDTKATEVTNEYSAGKLTITKEVTGNMGDKTKEFTVNVTFKALDGKEIKAPIKITTSNNTLNNPLEAVIDTTKNNNEATATIKVKDGTTVTFTNIPKGVTYTVEEKKENGYDTPKYNGTANETGVTGTITDGTNGDSMDQTVTITNNKGITIDTGIFVSNLPYLLALAGIAAAVLLFFAGKKRHSGED